jgi:hypothetical protein
MMFGLADRNFAKVENGGRKNRSGMALLYSFYQMVQRASAAAGDHRYCDCIGNRPCQADVESGFGAIPVHRGEQYLSSAKCGDVPSEFNSPNSGGPTAAMSEDCPALGPGSLGIDCNNYALAAEAAGSAFYKAAVINRCGIDRHLIGTGTQKTANIVESSYATAHRQRHETLLRRCAHRFEQDAAVLVARADIEKAELISTGAIIGGSDLYGVTGVAQVEEARSLYDTAVLYVQAGDYSNLQH